MIYYYFLSIHDVQSIRQTVERGGTAAYEGSCHAVDIVVVELLAC